MAPVDPPGAMTDSLSLGLVLDLIEKMQRTNYGSAYMDDQVIALRELDLAAIRALAEQHAAQLRFLAGYYKYLGDVQATSQMHGAADFLAGRQDK